MGAALAKAAASDDESEASGTPVVSQLGQKGLALRREIGRPAAESDSDVEGQEGDDQEDGEESEAPVEVDDDAQQVIGRCGGCLVVRTEDFRALEKPRQFKSRWVVNRV